MTSPRPSGTVMELAVDIAAPAAVVWRTLLEDGPAWLVDFRLDSTWVVGSPFAIRGTLNGKPYAEIGVVRAFEAGRRVSWDHWSRLWRIPDTPENRAILTITLEPVAGGTRVALHHALPEVEAIEPHARFFWTGALYRLREAAAS